MEKMIKTEQALILDPPTELHFKAPFVDVTTSYLILTNPTDRQVCFKVKTTAPKTYCVRPNSGIVPPKDTVTVVVMLQPFDFESADRSKHKFMVQSMFAPDGDINQETLWREALPENLMNSKLKCVFDVVAPENTQNTMESGDVSKEESGSSSEVVADMIKHSPPKAAHLEADAKKAFEDNKRLKAQLNELRQENSQLKEEGLRWRVARGSAFESQTGSSQATTAFQQQQSSHSKNESNNSMYILFVSSIVFVIGILIGKNVF